MTPLCTLHLTPISFQRRLSDNKTHTHTHIGTGLLRLVTHTLVSEAIKVLSANPLLQKLSHVARGVLPGAVTFGAPGTGTSHYFHGKGQTFCHLTLKWGWVELPWDNDQRSVFCFASQRVSIDLRMGHFTICLLVTVACRHGSSDNWLRGDS